MPLSTTASSFPSHTSPPLPSCELLDLVIDMDWDRVVHHVRDNPQDATWQDGDGLETPLYLACQHNAPVHAIRALLAAHPRAVTTPSRRRDIPLHIACRSGASIKVLEALLEHNPHTALAETKWGSGALAALCESFRHQRDVDMEFRTQKVLVLLRAAAKAKHCYTDDGEQLLVHAAVSLGSRGCPDSVLNLVLREFPHQLFLYDRMGRLPLHLVIRPTSWSKQLRRRYKPRERHAMVQLLQRHPDAARVKFGNRFPLHIAVSNGHQWDEGVRELFRAYPQAIGSPDPVSKLWPFQLAAIPVGESQASLDTVLELLLAEPNVLEFCSEYHHGTDRALATPESWSKGSSEPFSEESHNTTETIETNEKRQTHMNRTTILAVASLAALIGLCYRK